MFQRVKDIDLKNLRIEELFIDSMLLFSVVLFAFILIYFSNKEHSKVHKTQDVIKQETLKRVLLFVTIFFFIIALFYFLLRIYKTHEKDEFLENYNVSIEKDYTLISRKFEIIAEIMFETVLNTNEVHALMREAYGDKKEKSREALYALLIDKYRYYNRYDVRQLHFHLTNNESFLRFHRPNKYGDDLSGVRATVKWVNENHEKVQGFEEGRIYNGFRYVFPLSVSNNRGTKEHLGSVEVSFNAHAVANEFVLGHNAKVSFLVSKKRTDEKLFHEEKTNYEQSEFDDFYYDSIIKEKFRKAFNNINIEKLSPKKIEYINNTIKKGEIFTIPSEDSHSLFSVIPLKNAISHEVVGALIIERENAAFLEDEELFSFIFGGGSTLILLLFIFIYRELSVKLDYQALSLQNREILDTQKSMVLITDGFEMIDANKKLLEFYGYDSLESFKDRYSCLCETFIEDENYFHLKKVPEGITWISYLETIPHKERIVLVEDHKGNKHSFAVTTSRYNTKHHIFTFADITDTLQEQHSLENKVIHDKLTGAYNREFFELKQTEIVASTKESGRSVGIIFFDIDYFKIVNDTYGHGVGDSVLVELIEQISLSIRSNDYLIRWGGEEFIILLSANSADELVAVAENLRSKVAAHVFEYVGHMSCSFGVSLMLSDESLLETVRRADEALYISKENGRDRVSKR